MCGDDRGKGKRIIRRSVTKLIFRVYIKFTRAP